MSRQERIDKTGGASHGALGVLLLTAACVIPSFNASGKTCAQNDDCPAPFVCSPAVDGHRTCTVNSSAEPDAGGQTWWKPTPGTSWQIQLSESIDTSVDATVFAFDIERVSVQIADSVHQRGGRLICRIAGGVGALDDPEVAALPPTAVGNVAYGNTRWIDLRAASVVSLMAARIDRSRGLGCDAVGTTWLDGYGADTGLGLTESDASQFLVTVSELAHSKDLSIGLDNSVELAGTVVSSVDWAMNESCVKYTECDRLQPFTQAQKAVFHYELGDASKVASVCAETQSLGFSTIIKNVDVGVWRAVCK